MCVLFPACESSLSLSPATCLDDFVKVWWLELFLGSAGGRAERLKQPKERSNPLNAAKKFLPAHVGMSHSSTINVQQAMQCMVAETASANIYFLPLLPSSSYHTQCMF